MEVDGEGSTEFARANQNTPNKQKVNQEGNLWPINIFLVKHLLIRSNFLKLAHIFIVSIQNALMNSNKKSAEIEPICYLKDKKKNLDMLNKLVQGKHLKNFMENLYFLVK